MIIVSEKINGSIPDIAKAIEERNLEHIQHIVKEQEKSGADIIDCCAAVKNEDELEISKWLIDGIQEVSELPIAIDSSSEEVLSKAYLYCKRPGIINSVSGEEKRINQVFSVIANTEWKVVCLLSDDKGIPKSVKDRLKVLVKIMEKAREYGIEENRIYVDPLVEMLCGTETGALVTLETISKIRSMYPEIHIIGAVSNISYYLPARKIVNMSFLTLAINAGLDSVIMDSTDRELKGMIYATEALLGRDECCMEYIRAYKKGLVGE